MTLHDRKWFKKNRKEQYKFMKGIKQYSEKNNYQNHIIVEAPVKSGKRIMVEISKSIENNREHVFITALHRKADENQKERT